MASAAAAAAAGAGGDGERLSKDASACSPASTRPVSHRLH